MMHRLQKIGHAALSWGMDAKKISCTGKHHWFIQHHPVFNFVTKGFYTVFNILLKPSYYITIGPATFPFQLQRQIPVVQSDPWLNVEFETKVNNTIIKINTGLVHSSRPFRKNPAP